MNCSRCGKLIGENTMGTILPLCQCAWQQPQNTFYVQDHSTEVEALRKQVAALTQNRADWKVECGHAEALAANYMAQLAAMTQERDAAITEVSKWARESGYAQAQVALLREVLDTWGTHTSDEKCPVCEALEQTTGSL